MLRPIFKYSRTPEWVFDFAPHDAGQYPLVNGQVYGNNALKYQMPVEECGNMIILTAAICKKEQDYTFAAENMDLLEVWNRYLVQYGADPEDQLCTDDFAGHLAHNCNLSLKAIMGMVGFADILTHLDRAEEADALVEKAKEGVDVRIIYDDFGTMSAVPRNYPKRLEALHPNIKCIKFNPVIAFSYFSANCRDHRKIIVIDGECAYTGGVNIADRYMNRTSPYGYWKDSALRIDGGAADSFTLMFVQMWNAFREDKIDTDGILKESFEGQMKGGVVHPYCDMPHDEDNITESILVDMITGAKEKIYIFAPYLIIDHELRTLLCNAAKRGVDVRLVTPGIPDKKIVHRLSRANYRILIASGIKIYKYTPGFIHSKIYLADGDTALVSTANMDYRSLYLLYECGVYLKDAPQIRQIEDDIMQTISISQMVSAEELNRDGIIKRLFDSILRVFETLF
jgi:cardiolipin synthase